MKPFRYFVLQKMDR